MSDTITTSLTVESDTITATYSANPRGPRGFTGTVEVGTTTTSAPGGDAEVTNSGTSTAAILDFVIPRGEAGPNSVTSSTTSNGTATIDFDTVTTNRLKFDTTGFAPTVEGEETWSASEENIITRLKNSLTVRNNEDLIRHCSNDTGSTIAKGAPVKYAGSVGNSGKIRISLWDGSGIFLGLTAASIANGAEGFVLYQGKVEGIQTNGANYGETWASGDTIWTKLGSSGLTKTQPTAGGTYWKVGFIGSAHASNGKFELRVESDLNEVISTSTNTSITGLIAGSGTNIREGESADVLALLDGETINASVILSDTGASALPDGTLGLNSSGQIILHDGESDGNDLNAVGTSRSNVFLFHRVLAAGMDNTLYAQKLATVRLSADESAVGNVIFAIGQLYFEWTSGNKPNGGCYLGFLPEGFDAANFEGKFFTIGTGVDSESMTLMSGLSIGGTTSITLSPYIVNFASYSVLNDGGSLTNAASNDVGSLLGSDGTSIAAPGESANYELWLVTFDDSDTVTASFTILGNLNISVRPAP